MLSLQKGQSINNYVVVSELGPGVQGLVYLVEQKKTKLHFAMKCMNVTADQKSEYEDTLSQWKNLCQSQKKRYFVEYVEHFYLNENKNCVVIMEYCALDSLKAAIIKKKSANQKFSEDEVRKVLFEMIRALQELRLRNFVHHNIKSTNLLFGADGKWKLCDFCMLRNAQSIVGTMEYCAPEVINSEAYSFSSDVYSLGVVLYEMMVGTTPYLKGQGGLNMSRLLQGIFAHIPTDFGYSQALLDFVHACLNKDPIQRPSTDALLYEMIIPLNTAHHYLLKVLVVGDSSVGKTSLVNRYVHNAYVPNNPLTPCVEFACKQVDVDGKVVDLQLWDIAGQDHSRSMTRVYYREAFGAIVVFDADRPDTLQHAKEWKEDIDSKVWLPVPNRSPLPVVLFANKCDRRRPNAAQMDKFCQTNGFMRWFETSARDDINVEDGMLFILRSILKMLVPIPEEDEGDDELTIDVNSVETKKSEGGCC